MYLAQENPLASLRILSSLPGLLDCFPFDVCRFSVENKASSGLGNLDSMADF